MKRLLYGIFGFLVFLILAVVVVPLVVDVDRYRPQIIEVVNEHLNGKLELGKLSLSLWGQIRIEVAGMSLKDLSGKPIMEVKDAYFHVPFLSILSSSPVLTFKMDQPQLNLSKNKLGQFNMMGLVKTKEIKSSAPPSKPSAPMALPAIALRSRLGVELKNALLTYRDELTGLSTQVKDLNVRVRDISLSHPIQLEVWADLDTRMGTLQIHGPARIQGQAQVQIDQGKFEGVHAQAQAHFDSVAVAMGQLFQKRSGIPAQVSLNIESLNNRAEIKQLHLKFHNAEVQVSGKISPAQVHLNIKSNEIDLKPWSELIPLLKDYELGGMTHLQAEIQGPSDRLNYQGKLSLKGITAQAPHLKAQPKFDGVIEIATDQVKNFWITMAAPSNDLRVQGKLVSFLQPQIDIQVSSGGMDLDQLIDFPPPQRKKAPQTIPGKSPEKSMEKKAPETDYDALLGPLRSNKRILDTRAKIGIQIKMLKAYGITMTDILSELSLQDLVAAMNRFQMGLWGGVIKAQGSVQLKPIHPPYQFSTQVEGLDMKQAVESQFALFKNTLLGKAQVKIDGHGASFNPPLAQVNLNAKGSMKVEQATFMTIDMGRLVTEALNQAMDRLSSKVPALANKKVSPPAGLSSRYSVISSDFSIVGGKFSAPHFIAKAAPRQGIDLQGSIQVGLVDNSIQASWKVIDTFNLTRAQDLSVDVAGNQVEHILAERNQPVQFPVNVGCSLTVPCYSYTEVPEFLGKVVLNNISHAAGEKAKAELKKKAKELIEQAPPELKGGIEDLRKKFLGR